MLSCTPPDDQSLSLLTGNFTSLHASLLLPQDQVHGLAPQDLSLLHVAPFNFELQPALKRGCASVGYLLFGMHRISS